MKRLALQMTVSAAVMKPDTNIGSAALRRPTVQHRVSHTLALIAYGSMSPAEMGGTVLWEHWI